MKTVRLCLPPVEHGPSVAIVLMQRQVYPVESRMNLLRTQTPLMPQEIVRQTQTGDVGGRLKRGYDDSAPMRRPEQGRDRLEPRMP